MNSDFDKAKILYKKGKIFESKKICNKILIKENKHIQSLHLLALIELQLSKYSECIELINKSIELNKNEPSFYFIKGLAHHELKYFDLAVKNYNKAIELKFDYSEVFLNLGNTQKIKGNLNQALINYNKAIEFQPDYADAHNNKGLVLHELKKFDASIETYNRAINIDHNFAYAYNNLGNVLQEIEKFKSAIECYDKAISIEYDFFDPHYNKGIALNEIKKFSLAIKSYDEAIKINNKNADVYRNKANSLFEIKKLDLASENYDKALKINSELDYLLCASFFTKNTLCDWKNYNQNYERLKKKTLNKHKASMPFNILSIFNSPSIQKLASEINLKHKFKNRKKNTKINIKIKNKKLRIGYYSGDFREHVMSGLFVHLFELHDKSKFEIIGFSFGPEKKDEMRDRITASFDEFHDVRLKSDSEIVNLSRDLNIDIAIDLMCFTINSRFGIFIERCAPIQINFLGYPGTSGSDCMDYILADKTVIPKKFEKYYSEKIIFMPDTYKLDHPHRKVSDKNFTREELGLPKDGFVFCCFNKTYKITPDIFDIWMNILKHTKNSVLWLFNDENNLSAKKNLLIESKKRKISANRIIFAKRMTLDNHLSRLKLANLFIDTLPYNAHTTACDGLWVGLPFLTLAGDSFASRVGASMLNAINLPELITYTEKEYEKKAIELANNPNMLKKIKTKLEKNKISKPLFNAKLFTKNVENAYRKIYQNYIKKLPAKNIEI